MRKLALLLALLFALGLSGCGEAPAAPTPPSPETEEAAPPRGNGQPGLAIERDAGLDPFACVSSVNRLILSLVYDPLFRVNDRFEAIPVLAESRSVAADGKTTTVLLCEGLTFSDGSAISAEDAAESLRQAKESELYGRRLRHVTDIRAEDERTLTLTTDVPYEELALLLDIPIVRLSGENDQPIGSGAYVLEGTTSLRRREDKLCPLTAKSIQLIPVESSEGLSSGFRSGGISFLESDPNGDAPLLLDDAPNIWSVPTTELQFIGFNLASPVFSSGSVRSAVSYAIDRAAIVKEDLRGFGVATPLTAPPGSPWYVPELAESVTLDPQRLREAVASGTEVTFLVSTENPQRQTTARRIADSLTACGLAVKLSAMPPSAYAAALRAGNFDLYYGQIRLSPDLDPEPLFRAGSGACFGGLEALPQLLQFCDLTRANHGNSASLQRSILLDGVICPVAFTQKALCVREEAKSGFSPCVDRPLAG